MFSKKFFKSFLALFIILALVITALPPAEVSAKSKTSKIIKYCTQKLYENWESLIKSTNYLVLVGQANGTYVAYDNIASVTAKDKVMVKAKPLATALGLTYKSNTGRGKNKGCTLALGNDKNVYTRNSKTFYFYHYNYATRKTEKNKKTAEYKQSIIKSYNAVHCASLSTLVNYQYYDSMEATNYLALGYRGVVVYNKYSSITKIPDISNVTNLKDSNVDEDHGYVNNVKIWPTITSNNSHGDVSFVEATHYISNSSDKVSLDLSEVLNTFKVYGLPYDGVYGYGNCDNAVTIQGIDKYGNSVGEINTTGKAFLVNFPNAVKLNITGSQRNLMIDFTPVKPIVITDTTKLPFRQINWLYPIDGFARQYFVLADYMQFKTENVSSAYTLSRKILDMNNKDDPDYSSSYQRVTAVFKGSREEMTSNYRYIDVKKSKQAIDNSLVIFNDDGKAILPYNYETELLRMISTLISTGKNSYFPSKNWENKLVMKLPSVEANNMFDYITVDPSILDLNHFLDYYTHLHEMTHFYEAKQLHYGFQFPAWTEGNAITLAKKTMDALPIAHIDYYGNDYFDSIYATNYSFLTQDNKNNFESYYLNVTGWNASIIGYQFTNFIQKYYGSDVVYKIMEKVYAAKIPTNTTRHNVYDKQFTDCIKSATSQNVFQLFVDTCIN